MSGDTLAEPTGERRQLTVMFCDLVGSTALSGRMDPEDLREVISRYHQACARAIANNDGFLAQYLGDGIMAYFGYPAAQEDAAEKAVRAGLEILRELPSVGTPFGSALEARLGAATGVAVVGDLIGSGATELAAVIGAVPNIAARVQSVAAPGTFLIADSTRRLVGNVFEMRSLGIKDFKGLDRGIEVWQVLAERPESVRFDALRGPSPSRLVGRENEVAEIAAAWEAASASRGQVVWIAGDPGIGKSRLLRELGTQLVAMFRVSLQCSARYSGSP